VSVRMFHLRKHSSDFKYVSTETRRVNLIVFRICSTDSYFAQSFIKIKFITVLFFTGHHAIKTYWGVEV